MSIVYIILKTATYIELLSSMAYTVNASVFRTNNTLAFRRDSHKILLDQNTYFGLNWLKASTDKVKTAI